MVKKMPDLGSYTDKEAEELAIYVLDQLSLDRRVQVTLKCFEGDDRIELMNWMAEEDRQERENEREQ